MAKGQVHLSLTPELIQKIDEVANETFMNRSEFIKQAVLEKLEEREEWRAMLAGLVLNGPVEDEKELFEILRKRLASRSWHEDEKEWRREMRRRSLARKARRGHGL